MPTPDGPPVRVDAAPDELVTAVGGAVVPVDNSVVVVDDDGALEDEVVPEVPVDETLEQRGSSLGWSKKRATRLSKRRAQL